MWAVSSFATSNANGSLNPRCSYIFANSSNSPFGSSISSCFSLSKSAFSVSLCELTETYSPAAIDNAPAVIEAIPAKIIVEWLFVAAAILIITLDVDKIPSLAPKTAARSQLLLWR